MLNAVFYYYLYSHLQKYEILCCLHLFKRNCINCPELKFMLLNNDSNDKRNCICIKTAEFVLLIHKNFKVIQKMVYFLHLFQKGLLLAKSVNNSRFRSKVSFFRSNSKNQAIGVSIWNFAWSIISPKGMKAQLCLSVRRKSEISGHPTANNGALPKWGLDI